MPKEKGTPGGKLLKVSEEEYKQILLFHQQKYDPTEDKSLTPKQRYTFLRKAKKLTMIDDQQEGDWPHGPQLYVKCFTNASPLLPSSVKLYVPSSKVKEIIGTVSLYSLLTLYRILSQ
jgi:hypothetical protein